LLDGPIMVPMFERLERELVALRSQQAATERAKMLLETYGVTTTERLAIEPPS
jgi:hypothetical protein